MPLFDSQLDLNAMQYALSVCVRGNRGVGFGSSGPTAPPTDHCEELQVVSKSLCMTHNPNYASRVCVTLVIGEGGCSKISNDRKC